MHKYKNRMYSPKSKFMKMKGFETTIRFIDTEEFHAVHDLNESSILLSL